MCYEEIIKNNIKYDKINGEYNINLDFDDNVDITEQIVPISICWLIENKCNLNCIYCFSEHKNNNKKENYKSIADTILKFNPITIILTGGEPTLNRDLKNILEYIGDKAITIIDSNGTTNKFIDLNGLLNNSVVRFSIDSLNSDVIEKVRPSKILRETKNQIEKIIDNIDFLNDNNVPLIIQTVMTKLNINELSDIYEFLLKHKVKRWYISAVKYSEKCKDYFNEIGLTDSDIKNISEQVKQFNNDKIKISFSLEQDAGSRSRLFVEKSGKFFVDTTTDGIRYVGKDPSHPNHQDILEELDIQKHYDLYIKKKNLIIK